jgi:hypothetical protein
MTALITEVVFPLFVFLFVEVPFYLFTHFPSMCFLYIHIGTFFLRNYILEVHETYMNSYTICEDIEFLLKN